MRQYLEVELKANVDPFDVQEYLSRYTTMKVHIVDSNSIRIWYNENRITSKQVVKYVAQAANLTTQKAA